MSAATQAIKAYQDGIDDEFAEALAAENDSGKSFSEIADMIEKYLS